MCSLKFFNISPYKYYQHLISSKRNEKWCNWVMTYQKHLSALGMKNNAVVSFLYSSLKFYLWHSDVSEIFFYIKTVPIVTVLMSLKSDCCRLINNEIHWQSSNRPDWKIIRKFSALISLKTLKFIHTIVFGTYPLRISLQWKYQCII